MLPNYFIGVFMADISVQTSQNVQFYPSTNFSIYGMLPAYESATTIAISAGQCRDSKNVMDIVIGGVTPFGQQSNSEFVLLNVSKNGLNGLDQGEVIASTVYSIYAIADSSGKNMPGGIISLDSSFPILPRGYDSYRLVGFFVTDTGAQIIPFAAFGIGNERFFQYLTSQVVLTDGSATAPTFLSFDSFVPKLTNGYYIPSNNRVFSIAKIVANYVPAAAGNTFYISTDFNLIGQVATQSISESGNIIMNVVSGQMGCPYYVTTGDTVNISISGFYFSV